MRPQILQHSGFQVKAAAMLLSVLMPGSSTCTGSFIPPNHNPEGEDSYPPYFIAEETEAVQSKVT